MTALEGPGFVARLEARVRSSDSLLCVGLDPHAAQLIEPSAAAAKEFCLRIVRAAHPFVAAFKPNVAFFECLGADGVRALEEVLAEIPNDIPVVLDCKRGDIDTTASAYAAAAYEVFNADSVTLSPYMGWDSIRPFVTGKYQDRGAFVLCKTSNASSRELQKQRLASGSEVFEEVTRLVRQWNADMGEARLGLVAGATDLDALQRVRALARDEWILCPGVGAQGGEVGTVCEVGLRDDGSGLLVSVSRAVSGAPDIPQACRKLRDEINALRTLRRSAPVVSNHAALLPHQQIFLSLALQEQALRFGSFTLKSGRQSPYFFNAASFCTGHTLSVLGRCYAQATKDAGLDFDVIFGPAYKGIPLATAMATAWQDQFGESKAVAYNRKEAKDHGEGGVLVGAVVKGRRVLIVDDVITAGTAIREAVELLREAGAVIVATIVCLDRQEKANETSELSAVQQVSAEYGFPVCAIAELRHLVAFAAQTLSDNALLADIHAYRARYGAADAF